MTDEQARELAREYYGTTELSIDAGCPVTRAEGGAWVQAWVWVDDPEAEEEESDE